MARFHSLFPSPLERLCHNEMEGPEWTEQTVEFQSLRMRKFEVRGMVLVSGRAILS